MNIRFYVILLAVHLVLCAVTLIVLVNGNNDGWIESSIWETIENENIPDLVDIEDMVEPPMKKTIATNPSGCLPLEGAKEKTGEWLEKANESFKETAEQGATIMEHVKDKASEWTERAKDTIQDWQESAENAGSYVRDKTKEKMYSWIDKGKDASERVKQYGQQQDNSFPSMRTTRYGGSGSGDWSYASILQDIENILYPLRQLSSSMFDLPEMGKQVEPERPCMPSSASGIEWRTFDNEHIALIDLPGIPQQDILVRATPEKVYVKAEHSTCFKKPEENDQHSHLLQVKKESRTVANTSSHLCINRSFFKRLDIPADVDTDKMTAYFKNGILIIQFPKRPLKTKNIVVKSYEPGLGEKIKEKLGMKT